MASENIIPYPKKRQQVLTEEEFDKLTKTVGISDPKYKLDKCLFKGRDLEIVNKIIEYLKDEKVYVELSNEIMKNAKEERFRNYQTIDFIIIDHSLNQLELLNPSKYKKAYEQVIKGIKAKLNSLKSYLSDMHVEHQHIPRGIQIRKDNTIINLYYEKEPFIMRYSDDIFLDDFIGFNNPDQGLTEHITNAIYSFLLEKAFCPSDNIPINKIRAEYSEIERCLYIYRRNCEEPFGKIYTPNEESSEKLKNFLEQESRNRRYTLWITQDNIIIIGAGKTDCSNNYSFLSLYSFQKPVSEFKQLLEKVIKDSVRKYNNKRTF